MPFAWEVVAVQFGYIGLRLWKRFGWPGLLTIGLLGAINIPFYEEMARRMEWVDPPFCSGHWGPELVEIAGGHDPLGRKHRPSVQIDWRKVLDAHPEIMVLALCGYDIDRARRDYGILRRFPDFDSLTPAKSGEVYVVNASAYFTRPGPRIVDSIEIVAGILHPDKFPEFASRGPDDPRVVRVG
jgi:iron complex transport system substrate-binding protein